VKLKLFQAVAGQNVNSILFLHLVYLVHKYHELFQECIVNLFSIITLQLLKNTAVQITALFISSIITSKFIILVMETNISYRMYKYLYDVYYMTFHILGCVSSLTVTTKLNVKCRFQMATGLFLHPTKVLG
jgi:hypothetical protein